MTVNHSKALTALVALVTLIGGCLCLFIAWLFYLSGEKGSSFLFIYGAVYFFYFHGLLTQNFVSNTTLIYVFQFFIFLFYHYQKTFTRRFTLRVYSVVQTFLRSNSIVKLILWVLFVLLPTLIKDSFILPYVFSPVFFASLGSYNSPILFVLTLVLLSFSFLGISSHFKWFLKLRQRIVKYFSRRACLHFIGNNAGPQ
jgi:hypothetical protein